MKYSALIITAVASAALLAGCDTLQTQKTAEQPAAAAAQPATPPAPPSVTGQQAPAAQQQQGAPVTFLLAQKQKGQGMTELKLKDATLWYAPQPVLTRDDLAQVTPLKTANGQGAVRFNFTAEGAKKLSDLTARNKGRFLVIAVGNQLVSVPEIDAQLKDGVLAFPTATEAQAQAIVAAIAGRQG